MADTPQQAEARRQLASRGNALAPRVDPATGDAPKTRPGKATERRAVVKGAAEGATKGPAGAAVGAATGARKARKQTRSTITTARGTSSRSRGRKLSIGKLDSPRSGALFAEYFAAALVITLDLFVKSPSEGYLSTMSKVMMRLTALTAVFFVLFLMTGSKRGGQVAVWFGLLIDLGVIFTAARRRSFTDIADMVSGKGTGITLTDATNKLTAPHPEPPQLPDELTQAQPSA